MSNKQIAMPGIHDRIIEIMEAMPRGRVLDAPAGSGALSSRLKQMGFDVYCCDIDAGNFEHHGELPLTIADFNRDLLSYQDDEFDYVICSNGLHRLYYQSNIVNEFKRVCKPSGSLILSWPNYNSLARRLKFFITGSLGASIDAAEYDQTISDPAAKIRFPLSTGRMAHLLGQDKLSVVSAESYGYRFYDYALMPLSLLVIGFNLLIKGKVEDNRWAVISGGTTTICTCKESTD